MRAVIVGAGMGGLMAALALRQSGVFASVDIYEQTKTPSTAGAGLNIPPNGARICRWLGVDLDAPGRARRGAGNSRAAHREAGAGLGAEHRRDITPYATGAALPYYNSGYITSAEFWRLRTTFGLIFLAALLRIGVPILMMG